MPTRPSSRARKILEGLLSGKSLNELVPPGDPARAEVEAFLAAGLSGASKPATRSRSAKAAPSSRSAKAAPSSRAAKVATSFRSLKTAPASRSAKSAARPPAAAGGRAVAYSDGASRGNPGPAAIGIRLLDADGHELAAEGHRIGKTTNNVAEYRAAIAALEKALELGLTDLELRMDSELVVKQIQGEYRVKQPALVELKVELDRLLSGFRTWRVRHVRRQENTETDRLANEALDGV